MGLFHRWTDEPHRARTALRMQPHEQPHTPPRMQARTQPQKQLHTARHWVARRDALASALRELLHGAQQLAQRCTHFALAVALSLVVLVGVGAAASARAGAVDHAAAGGASQQVVPVTPTPTPPATSTLTPTPRGQLPSPLQPAVADALGAGAVHAPMAATGSTAAAVAPKPATAVGRANALPHRAHVVVTPPPSAGTRLP